MKFFTLLSSFAAVASATVGLLVPFYEYPYGDAALNDWNALITAVDAHPELPFYIIINMANGAPYTTDPPTDMKDFAVWIDKINKRSNAKAIGYLRVRQSQRDIDEVYEGLDQYANWTTYADTSSSSSGSSGNGTSYNITISGIFFDEIQTDLTNLQYNREITAYAKKAFAGRGGPVALNPGVFVQEGSECLFELADTIVQAETCYTNATGGADPDAYQRCAPGTYTPFSSDLLSQFTNETQTSKSSLIIHDYYESWTPYETAALANLQVGIQESVATGFHSIYMTQFGYTGNFTMTPASIINVAAYTAQSQGLWGLSR